MKTLSRTAFVVLPLLILAPMPGRAEPIAQRNFRVAIDGVPIECLNVGGGAVQRKSKQNDNGKGGGSARVSSHREILEALVIERLDTGDPSWREMVAARPARPHSVTVTGLDSAGSASRVWVFGGATAADRKTRNRKECTGLDVYIDYRTEILILNPASLDMSAPGAVGAGGVGACGVVADLDHDGVFNDLEYEGIAIGEPGVNGNFAGVAWYYEQDDEDMRWWQVSGPLSTARAELCAWMSERVGDGTTSARKPGDMDFLVGGGAGLPPSLLHAHDCTLVRYEFGVLDVNRDGPAQEMLTVECAFID